MFIRYFAFVLSFLYIVGISESLSASQALSTDSDSPLSLQASDPNLGSSVEFLICPEKIPNGSIFLTASNYLFSDAIRVVLDAANYDNPLGISHCGLICRATPNCILNIIAKISSRKILTNYSADPKGLKFMKDIIESCYAPEERDQLSPFVVSPDCLKGVAACCVLPLRTYAELYATNIYIREIRNPLPLAYTRAWIKRVIGMPYPISPSRLMSAVSDCGYMMSAVYGYPIIKKENRGHQTQIMCSEFVAKVFDCPNPECVMPCQYVAGSQDVVIGTELLKEEVPMISRYHSLKPTIRQLMLNGTIKSFLLCLSLYTPEFRKRTVFKGS
ncbi:MAG: hypothetical protein LBI20_02610 [Holosporales bacterium]|jgi:hypothetical protein|nr:hypothetical protein [Holosporales bacterium]